jgi:hypothetical protein
MQDGAQILYLLLAAVFMLAVTLRRTQRQTTGWKISAGLVWLGIFVGLAFLAEQLGLHTPNP